MCSVLPKFIILNFFVLASSNQTLNYSYINSVLTNITKHYEIQTVLIFRDKVTSKIDHDRIMLSENNQVTKLIVTSFWKHCRYSVDKQNTMSIVYVDSLDNQILRVTENSLKGLRTTKIVFINFGTKKWNDEDMQKFFEWCRKKSMVNSILITNSDSRGRNSGIYSFDPFPVITIKNLTNAPTDTFFMKSCHRNFHGVEFKTIFFNFIPRLYVANNNTDNLIESFGGTTSNIIKEFIKYTNISVKFFKYYELVNIPSYNELKMLYQNNTIEFTINAINAHRIDIYEMSFPLRLLENCLVLPYRKEIPKYMYVIIPYKSDVWIMILLTLFCMTLFLNIAKASKNNNTSYSESFLEVLSGIVFNSFPKDFRQYNSVVINTMCIAIMLLGFILTNIYLALSTSFLSKIVYGPQVSTVEDIIKEDIKIWVWNEKNKKTIVKYYLKNLDAAKKLAIYGKTEEYAKNKLSYGFVSNTDSLEFILQQFKRLQRKVFHKSNICIGESYMAFTFKVDSLLLEPMNSIILRVIQSGLYYYWRSTTFNKSKKQGLYKYYYDNDSEENPKKINLDQFIILWYFWAFGLSISLICFFFECTSPWIKMICCKSFQILRVLSKRIRMKCCGVLKYFRIPFKRRR